MTKQQLEALFVWLDAQSYSGDPGTDGAYVRMEELHKYLPDAINTIMEQQ